MNRLFLLFPAATEESAGADVAYLRVLGEVTSEHIINLFSLINRSRGMITEEDVVSYYDERHLQALFSKVEENCEMPQLENLLSTLTDVDSIQNAGLKNEMLTINGIQIESGLLNSWAASSEKEFDALVDLDALNSKIRDIDARKESGEKLDVVVLPAVEEDVYKWLVDRRNPPRVLDADYEKHTQVEKIGKKGVKISAMNYPKERVEEFLKRAVPAKKGLRELYFKDIEENKIIIFFDENLSTPTYHCFEVSADDALELHKISQRGGRNLQERIEKSARIV
ncbi:hypothetical protein HMPREF3034_01547 [Prevotella sp. DNF00663]|uniref:hypothetical protein n=1 Tax=Prevotella sp. DNF00663 TaxID=1384078 RepID=UPI0007804194|nr:hypothetical protein [Prevotella sp. DNF00663]KXB82543.1 hypothetical protein HMPREF3034_01547 [Prevotella sp. DNF00663]